MIDKALTQVRMEIKDEQTKELLYKGSINDGLYLISYNNDKPLKKVYWKNRSKPLYEKFINTEKKNNLVTEIIVTNEYDDWKVIAYQR